MLLGGNTCSPQSEERHLRATRALVDQTNAILRATRGLIGLADAILLATPTAHAQSVFTGRANSPYLLLCPL